MSPAGKSKRPPPPFDRRQALTLVFGLVVLGILIGLTCGDPVARQYSIGYWPAVLAVFVVVVVVMPAVVIGLAVLLALLRNWRMRSEEHEFGRVRKIAQTEGAVLRIDAATVWVAEADDHPPVLHQALEATRSAFQALLPTARLDLDQLRMVCFEDRRDFEAYGRVFGLPLEALDGLYLLGRPRRLVVAAEVVPRRAADPTRTLRALFAHSFLERFKGFLLPTWLNTATTHVVAAAGERGELGRLNRKVLALLARNGLPKPDDIFGNNKRQIVRLLRGWGSLEGLARLWQLLVAARSMGEYLAGGLASAERRLRFCAFVTELKRTDAPEKVFVEAFGYGYDRLLVDWREAVEALGVGTHEPPPERVREAILNRALSVLEDRRARRWERIRTIRDLGNAGYPLGADALIRILEDERGDVAHEAAFALEAISGMAAGEDVGRWWTWWQGLPSAVVPVRDTAIREGPK